MNIYLFAASILTLILVLARSILGELKIFRPMDKESRLKTESLPVINGLPMMWKTDAFTYNTIRFIWHVASILGLAMISILAFFSFLPELHYNELKVVMMIAFSMFACGLIALIYSRGSHMGWILFFIIGILCLIGG